MGAFRDLLSLVLRWWSSAPVVEGEPTREVNLTWARSNAVDLTSARNNEVSLTSARSNAVDLTWRG